MAQSPSSSLGVPGVNIRGIFFGVIVVALIAALFFIPEIIDYQRSSRTNSSPAAQEGNARASNSIFSSNGESPLAKLKNLINGGFSDRARMKKVVERGDSAVGFGPNGQKSASQITWDDIHAKDAKKQMQSAQSEVSEIARALPVANVQSRYALVTLANGLRDVMSGDAEKALSPTEAVRYLEYLHSNVSRSMLQENVDRLLFERWRRVSFGSLLAQYSGTLDRQFVPFNPQLTLTEVEITQNKRRDKFETQDLAKVSTSGYVVGTDIEKIEIWGGGTLLRTIKLGKPDARGIATFTTSKMEARGLLTLRVISKEGQKFEKVYQFFPRFRIFPYHKGKYLIPAAAFQGDTSVDRFFTRGIPGSEQAMEGGSFFGGPLISRF